MSNTAKYYNIGQLFVYFLYVIYRYIYDNILRFSDIHGYYAEIIISNNTLINKKLQYYRATPMYTTTHD